uniref:Uncharacterized protein n=1 Tax=Rhizophora mucronata TaxID=61149 RepID=A0A2P2PGF1_RHIMU
MITVIQLVVVVAEQRIAVGEKRPVTFSERGDDLPDTWVVDGWPRRAANFPPERFLRGQSV